MSFEIYVGNYPTSFTEEDVENLFTDFGDVKLLKFIQKDTKCFSFLTCQDIDQVLSIIEEMNDSIVGGRELKVRAQDQEVQDYVELLRKEGYNDADLSDEDEVPSLVPFQATNDKKGYNHDNDSFKNNSSDSASLYDSNLDDHDSLSTGCSSKKVESNLTFRNSSGSNVPDKFSNISEDVSWVSVTNFPFNTSVRNLYKLFSDYDPVKIYIICNQPTKDRAITEAYVCFSSKDIASDVILNFDNTVFHRRLLLVNDIEDLSVLNELLVVSHK